MLDQDALGALKQLKQDLREQRNLKTGVVRGTRGNFGFVVCEDESQVFLPPDEMSKVFPEDRVEVEIDEDSNKRLSGKVDRVLESTLKRFFGHCVQRGKALFAVIDENGR